MADQPIKLSEYIRQVMEAQKRNGKPSKFLVLRNWNQIVDHDCIYTLRLPTVPPMVERATRLWVMESQNSPDLTEVFVLDDRGQEGLWVQHSQKPIQWLVQRDEAKVCPMPYRPLAVARRELHLYLGEVCAREWHETRRKGKEARHAANG